MGIDYSGTYAVPREDLGAAFMEHAMGMEEFIGLQVLPLWRSQEKAANYPAITRETLLQDSDAKRPVKGTYNRITVGAKDKSFECKEFGLEGVVDDAERALFASDFDAEDVMNLVVAHALMLQHEKRVAAAVFDTVKWTGASLFTDNSASPWSTVGTDIIAQVVDAREKVRQNSGMKPNALIISAAQLPNLFKNTGIKNQFPGAPLITLEMIERALAAIFGLERLIVGGLRRNTAKEGAAFSGADVWSDSFAMIAKVCGPADPPSMFCIGRTVLWVPDSPNEITIEMYREEQSRGDVLRARHHVQELVLDENAGHLLDIKA